MYSQVSLETELKQMPDYQWNVFVPQAQAQENKTKTQILLTHFWQKGMVVLTIQMGCYENQLIINMNWPEERKKERKKRSHQNN